MSALERWRQAKVRAIGQGDSFTRFTPDFAVQLRVGRFLLYYGTRKGFKRTRRRR